MNTRSNYLLKVALAFLLSILITSLLIIPAKAGTLPNQTDDIDDPYRIETFRVSDSGSLDVETSGGHITVEGSSQNSVRVEMYVRKDGRELTPDDTDLSDWEIDISQSGQSIKAVAKRETGGWNFFGSNNHPSVSFIVYTPREMNTHLNTSGGHIHASGLVGDQQMRTSGGHLELSDLEGDVEARTSGGHISVSNLQGKLNTRTSGGNINLANISGTVEARTSGGNIEAAFVSIDSSIALRTSGGNINIILPRNRGMNLDLKGSLVHADLNNFSGKTDRDQIEGEINGGGPSVSVRTSGGIVSLLFS